MIAWLYLASITVLNVVILGVSLAHAQGEPGGTQSITQFITLRDLATFPGQSYVVGILSEALKRLLPIQSDGINRALMTAGAIAVNFIAALAMAPAYPETPLLMGTLVMMSILNGTAISVAAMKSIEFVVERVQREIATEMAKSGVTVTTNVSTGPKPPAGTPAPEPAPMASLATQAPDHATTTPAAPVAVGRRFSQKEPSP